MTDSKINVHHYERTIESSKQILDSSDKISDENKQLIFKFINFCETDSRIGLSRIRLYLYCLRKIGELSDKPFRKLSNEDIRKILSKIQAPQTNGKKYSENTMHDFRKAISKFWRWMYFAKYRGEAPPQIRGIKVGPKSSSKEPEIYTKQEINAIINGLDNLRDKTFFKVLYDVAMRVGECISRTVGDIRYTDNGDIEILVEADKTRCSHWETLFESSSIFSAYMKLHPAPDNPDAPLWVARKKGSVLEPMGYGRVRAIFLNACKKQGIRSGRRNNIHKIRASKASHDMMDKIPIPFIESRGSWSKGSRSLQRCYLAVIKDEKSNAYREKYGMKKLEKNDIIELKRCWRCDCIIERGSSFCGRCGAAKDLKTAIEARDTDEKAGDAVDIETLTKIIRNIVIAEIKQQIS